MGAGTENDQGAEGNTIAESLPRPSGITIS
jgi:hypothetical protein